MAMPNPQRGEVWMVDFGIAAKVRPAVVLSIEYKDDDRAIIGVVPHTTKLRGSQFELTVPVQHAEGSDLPPLLRTHTVLGLDAGADAPRVAIYSAALTGGA